MLPLTFHEKQRLRDFLRECQHVRNLKAGARCTSWSDVKRCAVEYIMDEAEEEKVSDAEWWVNSCTQTQTPLAASASAASDRDHCAVKRPREKKTPKNRVEPEPEEEFSSQPDLEEASVVSIDDDDGLVEVEGQGCWTEEKWQCAELEPGVEDKLWTEVWRNTLVLLPPNFQYDVEGTNSWYYLLNFSSCLWCSAGPQPIVQYPICLAVAQQKPNLSISCQPLSSAQSVRRAWKKRGVLESIGTVTVYEVSLWFLIHCQLHATDFLYKNGRSNLEPPLPLQQRFLEACKASGTVTQKQYAKPAHVRIYPQQDVFYNLNLSFFGINSWVLSLRTSVQWMPWPRLCPVSFQMPMESHGFFLVVRVYTLHWWRLCLTANTELYVQIQQGKKLYLSPVRCMSNFLFQFSMAAVQMQEWHQDVI